MEVYDWDSDEVIDEVLLAEAAAMPAQLPLLANHSRYSLDDVIGSIRGIRLEAGEQSSAGCILQTMTKHCGPGRRSRRATSPTSRSAIASARRSKFSPDRRQSSMAGQFKAGKRTLRVATKWTPKEGSLVPIGADQAAKIREQSALIFSERKVTCLRNSVRTSNRSVCDMTRAMMRPMRSMTR